MATTAWDRNAVVELIHLYESRPCLYAVGSSEYHNKMKRGEALRFIAQEVSKVRPNTSVEEVKAKVNGLRTQFLSERNKMKKSEKSGCSPDDVYTTKLWCYKMLMFMEPHSMPRRSTSNLTPGFHAATVLEPEDDAYSSRLSQHSTVLLDDHNYVSSQSQCDFPVLHSEVVVPCSTPLTSNGVSLSEAITSGTEVLVQLPVSASASTPTAPQKRRRNENENFDINKVLKSASEVLDKANSTPELTHYEHFGHYVGQQLKKINNAAIARRVAFEIHGKLLEGLEADCQ